MTFWPYLILRGWLPYKDIAIVHTPFLVLILAAFYRLFGVGIWQLKIFTWLLVLLTDVLLFGIVKKLWSERTAFLTLMFYVFLQYFYEGNGLWFELAFTPFALLVFYSLKTKKYLQAGILWGLAIITKQTAVWFFIPVILTLLPYKGLALKDVLHKFEKILIGIIAVLIALVILLLIFGIFNDFWFWAIKFGVFYLPRTAGQVQLPTIRQFLVYFLPFVPLILTPELVPWAIAGFLGVYPRWGLFHFQPATPFLSIGLGLVITKNRKKFKIFLVAYVLFLITLIGRQFIRDFGKETRFYEHEVQEVVSSIKNQPSNVDDIYILNYWDNIYAFTNTLPSTEPWFPYLPWYLSVPGVKDEMLGDLKTKMPQVIIVATEPKYNWKEVDDILRYYSCNSIDSKVQLCQKND